MWEKVLSNLNPFTLPGQEAWLHNNRHFTGVGGHNIVCSTWSCASVRDTGVCYINSCVYGHVDTCMVGFGSSYIGQVCVCVVCVRARARVCVCVYVCVRVHVCPPVCTVCAPPTFSRMYQTWLKNSFGTLFSAPSNLLRRLHTPTRSTKCCSSTSVPITPMSCFSWTDMSRLL